MAKDKESPHDEGLEAVDGDVLPDREMMSIITPGIDDPLPPSAVLDSGGPLQGGEEL